MPHKLLSAVIAASAFIAAPRAAPASECSLTAFAWLAGNWHSAADPDRSQERWVIAPDQVLMGSAWELPAGKAGYAEIMTIRLNNGATAMILRHFDGALSSAWEERNAPMVFNAATCERTSAIFDGQGDHAGEHLSYSRSGNDMTIVGNFLHQGKPVRMEWHMVRAGD